MPVIFSFPTRLVRLSLVTLVILSAFFVALSSRRSAPQNSAPIPPIPVDVAEGQRIAWEYSQNDNYNPEPGHPARTYQEHYFQEVETVPKQFENFPSTVNRIKPPAHLRHPEYFQDDPRRQEKRSSKLEPMKRYHPYPDYNSDEWKSSHRGEYVPCMGPRGVLLNESMDDSTFAYMGIPQDFPKPVFGSHALFDMDTEVCFDRYSRYGPYGFGENETAVEGWIKPQKVDWNNVDWGTLQAECVEKNAARFDLPSSGKTRSRRLLRRSGETNNEPPVIERRKSAPAQKRTAFLLRSWTGKEYSENDKHNIRSMVTELSLMSGGEYEVVLLVHVKDDNIPIWEEATYQAVLEQHVPKEFWNITELWSMSVVKQPYKALDESMFNVHLSQWLPIQDFARRNPEFDYFWNWEIDSRFTGHLYEFLERVTEFGRRQPRKGLWERSERFWIPDLHGDYDDQFRKYVRRREDQFVWGPYPIPDIPEPLGPKPPVVTPAEDDYSWGVGEDADVITFLPIFDPVDTNWVIRDHLFNYQGGVRSPRRTTIITQSRISRRVLQAMDFENMNGRHLASEMFPQTAALLHGYKAVYAPHPIYSERKWSPHRLDRWFNPGPLGKSGSSMDSPFGWARESRFDTLSWYYRCNLPGLLYWNFIGWKHGDWGGRKWEAHHGRVCLPAILFHPVKDASDENADTHYEFPHS
ncbi:hypothetical protein VTO42DRAFT_3645 [Malbranchea cinnamomea]